MTPDLSNASWRKSSRSQNGGNCVEIATVPVTWRKSSRSQNGGNCVEVAPLSEAVAVRDSKDPSGPVLAVAPAAWGAFTTALQHNLLSR